MLSTPQRWGCSKPDRVRRAEGKLSWLFRRLAGRQKYEQWMWAQNVLEGSKESISHRGRDHKFHHILTKTLAVFCLCSENPSYADKRIQALCHTWFRPLQESPRASRAHPSVFTRCYLTQAAFYLSLSTAQCEEYGNHQNLKITRCRTIAPKLLAGDILRRFSPGCI